MAERGRDTRVYVAEREKEFQGSPYEFGGNLTKPC